MAARPRCAHLRDVTACLCHNGAHRRFIDVQLKHVGPAVVTDDIKVELSAANLTQIKRRHQDGFAFKMRSREHLAQWADDRATAPH